MYVWCLIRPQFSFESRISVPQVSHLEQELERERSTSLNQLRRKQVEVEETKQEVQKKEKQAAELSASIT